MNWLAKIFGTGAGEIIKPLADGLDKLFTSKDEKLTHEEIRMRILNEPSLAQIDINKAEAQHRTVFVAGWRPFIGWVCGLSLGAYYIPQFVLASYLWVKMCLESNELLAYPDVNADSLFELVLAMLGMAGLRTYEKLKGKSK
jgi:hypothetical protein